VFAVILAACVGPGAEGPPAPSLRYQPGIAYYSDEYVLDGEVYQLGEEKNLEEVYQYYTYYEAIHDDVGRVATFKRYLRGDLDWTERYTYDRKGRMVRKEHLRPGHPPEVTNFDP
jgi:hypothetical protein